MLQEVERLGGASPVADASRRTTCSAPTVAPACGTPCAQCSHALSFGWVACPYCGADRVPLTAADAARSQTQAVTAAGSSVPGRPLHASAQGGRASSLPANTEPLP